MPQTGAKKPGSAPDFVENHSRATDGARLIISAARSVFHSSGPSLVF